MPGTSPRSSLLAGKRRLLALGVILFAGVTAGAIYLQFHRRGKPKPVETREFERPPIQLTLGKTRAPLPYRIISFHRGRADKNLVRLAAQLGFNGVQIQIEGSTVNGIKQFAQYDASEHIVEFCHKLGMQVTLWVHELSDVPSPWMPEWLGPLAVDNPRLWPVLDARYDWMLHEAVPNIDGLVLTVVETQVRATEPAVLKKLVEVVRAKCDRYKKSLTVRTFVWYPDEYADLMSAVAQLPQDTLIMSKCVPQDWQMRGGMAREIGNVGGRPQIVEFDVAGEYFLRDHVSNCMPDLLKAQFDYGLGKNISGICVRVDRDYVNVLNHPAEVNLWALGLLAAGASDNLDEIWSAYTVNRFGPDAAQGVIRALRPTGEVVAEMLSVGPFTFGDTRYFPPPLADEELFQENWQNWWWDDSFVPTRIKAEEGEAAFIAEVKAGKEKALRQAQQCLINLDLVRDKLKPEDYAILKTKLWTNQVQLAFRAPMAMSVLHYQRLVNTDDPAERAAMDQAMREDLAQVRAAAAPVYSSPQELNWLGRKWWVGPPEDVQREVIFRWAYEMDQLRRGEDPRPVLRTLRGKSRRSAE